MDKIMTLVSLNNAKKTIDDAINNIRNGHDEESGCIDKRARIVLMVLAVIGALAAIAGIAYFVYNRLNDNFDEYDYLDDFEDDPEEVVEEEEDSDVTITDEANE